MHRLQLQNDVNPSLQFPATKQRDEYIHVLGCCKTPIYLSAIKPMFLCCGWNKHFTAPVIEEFELFFWSQLEFQGWFVNCLLRYPSSSAEASPLGQPFPVAMAVASRVTQPLCPPYTHRSVAGALPRACNAWAESSWKQKLCSQGKQVYWTRTKCQSDIFVEMDFQKNLISWALK